MRTSTRLLTGLAAIASACLLLATTAACDDKESGSSSGTLTYWASNQGTSLDNDRQILQPELEKFQQQTGIKVKLEVVGWPDLLNRILAATTSGKGPDVLNIGNTWSASLQATGAFLPFGPSELDAVGGKSRFLPTSLAATGAEGKTPAAVPLYGLSYGLFYNKKMFADAGITAPPATWAELVADGKKLTTPEHWGMSIEGGSYTENAHFAFIFGQQQGAELFNSAGKPQFASPKAVEAVKQYVDLMASDKIVNPSTAQYTNGTQSQLDFGHGKAALLMAQYNATANIASAGMSPDQYGVAPIPVVDPLPQGGKKVNSHVAGINVSVFKNTKNRDGALKLVKFLTDASEQQVLNKAFGTLPVVGDAYTDAAFQTPQVKVFQQVLAETSAPLPQIAQESQFETTVGAAMRDLFAKAASGKPVSASDISAALTEAQQKMTA